MGIRPEDIIPDDQNFAKIGDIVVRKGSMAALLANADVLMSKVATVEEKVEAKKMIVSLAPTFVAIGLLKHITWKNPEIQRIFEHNSDYVTLSMDEEQN